MKVAYNKNQMYMIVLQMALTLIYTFIKTSNKNLESQNGERRKVVNPYLQKKS